MKPKSRMPLGLITGGIIVAMNGVVQAEICDPGNPGAMFILPVRATGIYFIEGNSITVYPGARVWFEVHVCNWDPDGLYAPLKGYNFKTAPEDVYGSPSIQPPPEAPCQTPADCDAVYGVGSLCDNDSNSSTGDYCEYGFFDTTRPDWIFADCSNYITAVDLSVPVYVRMGANCEFSEAGVTDNGQARYLATFVYDIPVDAPLSPISIPFNLFETYMYSATVPVPEAIPVEKHSATVQLYPGLPRSRHVPVNIPPTAVQEGSTGQGLRVTLGSLHHPDAGYNGDTVTDYSSFEGQIRWVGPVGQYTENQTTPPYYYAAPLQCKPYFADWTSLSWVYIYGSEVIPSSTYIVELVDVSCSNLNDPSCYTTLFTYTTNRWGDIAEPFSRPGGSNQPDVSDISAVLDKFKNLPTAVQKSRAQMQPNSVEPDAAISFADVSFVVDAFKGLGYGFPGPSSCP